MALQLVIGESGSGKSTWVIQKVMRDADAHPDRHFIFVVPEQFTLQTQRDLVMMNPRRGILNIDVLSFKRLAVRVFEETGTDTGEVLSEIGKTMLVRRSAGMVRGNLKLLGQSLDRLGYVTGIKSQLSEFAQYDLGQAEIAAMAEKTRGKELLKAKLEDLRVLQETFDTYLREKYITGEQILGVLADVCADSRLIRESTFVFDSFTGFTPLQEKVLSKILRYSQDVTVTVCADPAADLFGPVFEYDLFALSHKTVSALVRLAREAGTAIKTPVRLSGENGRFRRNPQMNMLQKNLFRYRSGGGKVKGGEQEECIRIVCMENPAAEVAAAAAFILELVRDKEYRYRDIAVIAGDLPSYQKHAIRVFKEMGIPCFIDHTLMLRRNKAVHFIHALLEIGTGHFDYRSVMALLRCGVLPFEREKIDVLENYILAGGIRYRSDWEKTWTGPQRSFDAAEIEMCEGIRETLMTALKPFLDLFLTGSHTVREYVTVLYETLCTFSLAEAMIREEEKARNAGDESRAKEYHQIYGAILSLLEEMDDLMGTDLLSAKEFSAILEAGLGEARIGIVPPSLDQVQVGDMTRTRLAHVKYLLFLGLNDGWIPGKGTGGGILTELERSWLKEEGFALAPGERENSLIARFYLYLILTKAEDGLYLSCSRSDGQGRALRPSYLLGAIEGIEGLKTVRPDQTGGDDEGCTLNCGRDALEEYGRLLQAAGETGRISPRLLQSAAYLKESDFALTAGRMWEKTFASPELKNLSPGLAKELFRDADGSVTRLELFSRCPYEHFAQYGLKLKEREIWQVKMTDIGTFFHEVLYLYARTLREEHTGWREVLPARQKELIRACIAQLTEEKFSGRFEESARAQGLLRRLEEIAGRTVWAITNQLRAGSFEPAAFEISFDEFQAPEAVSLKLKDGTKLRLRGRIDRIDVCESEDTRYIKVVDYKSGNTVFDLSDIYHGLSMQLAVYLHAALKLERALYPDKKVIPAALLYSRMKDPIIEDSDEPAENAILKQMRPDGLVNRDDTVLALLDRRLDIDNPGKSLVVPVERKKSGWLTVASSAADTMVLENIGKYAMDKMAENCSEILEGEIRQIPGKWKNRTACDYCLYRDVCGFDTKYPQYRFRMMSRIDEQEFLRMLKEGGKTGGEEA